MDGSKTKGFPRGRTSIRKEIEVEGYEYQLVRPFTIVKIPRKVIYTEGDCLVKPVAAGICGSDLLYFKGDKDPRKLYTRLPLVLLHEGVVEIVNTDERACIVPFKTCGTCYSCLNGMENLCIKGLYMGSNAPGLSRSMFSYPKELIINIPLNLPLRTAVILEPMSVVYRMVNEIDVGEKDRIAVIGTGLLGLLTIIFLSRLMHVNKSNLYLIGRSNSKLEKMRDLCQTINISNLSMASMMDSFSIVVEAVGGHSMSYSVMLATKLCRPRGRINVFGLSDSVNNINFTEIIKKGLILVGFSRSKFTDYTSLKEIINQNADLVSHVERVIDPKQFLIRSELDLMDAFHYAMSGNNEGRVMVSFVGEGE